MHELTPCRAIAQIFGSSRPLLIGKMQLGYHGRYQ
jgi:hypothetical protein